MVNIFAGHRSVAGNRSVAPSEQWGLRNKSMGDIRRTERVSSDQQSCLFFYSFIHFLNFMLFKSVLIMRYRGNN